MDVSSSKDRPVMDGVPDYRTADDETRALMDDIIQGIDPYDINTILTAGNEPLERLGNVADQVMRRSGSDGAILSSLDALQEEIAEISVTDLAHKAMGMGVKGAGWLVRNPGTAIASVAATTFLGPMALVGLPFAKNQLDKFSSHRQREDVADTLRKTIAKSGDVIERLKEAGEAIPRELESIDELGRARVEAYYAVSLHIGAFAERLRRLDDEEIPALQMQLAERPNYDKDLELQTLQMSSEQLAGRINTMLASRLVSQAAMTTLMRLKGIFAQAAGKVQNHLGASVPQWKAQIAESGLLLTANKVTEAIREADEFGTNVFVQGAAVANKTALLMSQSVRKGTYDPQKLIGVLKDMTTSLGNDVKLIGSRRTDLEADRARLSLASAEFRSKVTALAAQAEGRLALPAAIRSQPLAIEGAAGPQGMG